MMQFLKLRLHYSRSLRYLTTTADLRPGSSLHGYTVGRVGELADINASYVHLTHNNTGAQHFHIARDDSNNTFSVGFRTFPENSTGISHILEHTTLCGSSSYPVRDPFFKMLTRSTSNFMNAFTANDWTMYLFSTTNSFDFQNLMSVYLDSVFNPLLREMDFRQEGWRMEHSDTDDKYSPITFKGIVFNEMKGVFGNPENIFSQALQNNLFPSHTYSHVSGGEPLSIPDLTHDDLCSFHQANYHPSNSFFFTYGNIPLEGHLQRINDVIKKKTSISSRTSPMQMEERCWEDSVTKHVHCSPDPSLGEQQTTFSISYKLPKITDIYESFVMRLVCLLLVEGISSPFYKSLLNSGIGSGFSPSSGYNDDTLEAYFSIGLQGIMPNDVDRVEEIILSTLKEVSKVGFTQERIDSALHQMELGVRHQRQNFGLFLSTRLISPWIHGCLPEEMLYITENVQRLMNDLKKDPSFFQSKIEKYFLSNKHCLKLVMSPSSDYLENLKKTEALKLMDKISSLSLTEIEGIYSDGLKLRSVQTSEVENSRLPKIQLSELDETVKTVESYPVNCKGAHPILFHQQPTNGLSYLNMKFDFAQLPENLKEYVPFFCYVITRMGAGDLDFAEFSQQCEMVSGGLSVHPVVVQDKSALDKFYLELLCSSHCLNRNVDEMLKLWTDVICRSCLADVDRINLLLKQLSNDLAFGISQIGHRYAIHLASGSILPSSYYAEKLMGISQIKFLKELLEKTDMVDVMNNLKLIAHSVFNPHNLRVCINADSKNDGAFSAFLDKLPECHNNLSNTMERCFGENYQRKIMVKLPYSVNYVGMSMKSVPYTHHDTPSLDVLAKLISMKYLHKQIREMGGAYGSGARNSNGVFSFMSYRDPNCLSTIDVFNQSSDWIMNDAYSVDDVEEAVLSVVSEMDSPVPPGEKGVSRFLKQVSHDDEQQYRDRVLKVSKQDLKDVSQKYLATGKRNVAVVGQGIEGDETWTRVDL